MRGVLVWTDGAHEETSVAGGNVVIVPRRTATGYEEVLFRLTTSTENEMTYTEESRRDITSVMAEAKRDIEERRMRMMRRCMATSATGGPWHARLRRRIAAMVAPK